MDGSGALNMNPFDAPLAGLSFGTWTGSGKSPPSGKRLFVMGRKRFEQPIEVRLKGSDGPEAESLFVECIELLAEMGRQVELEEQEQRKKNEIEYGKNEDRRNQPSA